MKKNFTTILILAFCTFNVLKCYSQTNPVITGDWSDAGVVRVGEDYYSVRSTFGWQPGLLIIHSKDLIHWEYCGAAYTNTQPLIKTGEMENGIWGSDIGYNPNNKTFLVYAPLNFGIYAFYSNKPEGPYTMTEKLVDGIDPGFFADDDGKLYLTESSGKIYKLTDDGLKVEKQVGKRLDIKGWAPGEGPEIAKNNGYYYYFCSEGGTCPYEHHKILSYRAKSLEGPWEADPENPVKFAPVTSKAELQGPGHGELIKTQKGEWWLTYHVYDLKHYSLARQTCLEPVEWTKDGWWRPKYGKIPPMTIPKPNLPQVNYKLANSDDFDSKKPGLQWFFNTLPDYSGKSWSLEEKPGYLRIKTQKGELGLSEEVMKTVFLQRVNLKAFEMSCKLDFDAKDGKESAGLLLYSDMENYVAFTSTVVDGKKKFEISRRGNDYTDPKIGLKRKTVISIPNTIGNIVYLKIKVVDPETAYFFYSSDGIKWEKLDYEIYFGHDGNPDLGWKCMHWTGTTMGIFAEQNQATTSKNADFDYFKVEEIK